MLVCNLTSFFFKFNGNQMSLGMVTMEAKLNTVTILHFACIKMQKS